MQKIPLRLWLWIGAVSAFVLCICAVRYSQFQYDGLDLGIYHQVVWNSAHGRWFQFSFNEASYLVDHREWLLVFFVPLYWIINHPFTLIVMQTVIVNSAAIPIYLLIRYVLPEKKRIALVGAVLLLLHPTVINMQFFEFHMLVFVVPLTLWWWYGIVTTAWWRWIFFLLLLLLREDIAITTAAAGIVIWLYERSRWKEAVIVMTTSSLWFVAMVWAGSYFSVEDNPLFFTLYAWMGNSPLEAIRFMVLNPIEVALHIFSLNNFFLLFLFLMTTAFLPLAAMRYMLPAIAGLMVYFLMDAVDIGMAIFVYHYGAPMAAWTCIAAVYGYARLQSTDKPIKLPLFTARDIQQLSGVVIIMTYSAAILFFGPHWIMLDTWVARHEQTQGLQKAITTIPKEAAVMSSDRSYVALSSREKLYSAKYTQTGLKHYSGLPYVFQPFQWALLTDETPRVWNNNSIEEKTVAAGRLGEQIRQNDLVPIQLFEQGVLYGPRSAGLVEQLPVRDVEVSDLDDTMQQRIHPTATLAGYSYNQQTQQFHLHLKRENDELAQQFIQERKNEQDIYVRIYWNTSRGAQGQTQYRLLGSLVEPLYTWEPNRIRTMILPWQQPDGAQNIQLHFGTLTMPQQFFFVTQSVRLDFQKISEKYSTVNPILLVE